MAPSGTDVWFHPRARSGRTCLRLPLCRDPCPDCHARRMPAPGDTAPGTSRGFSNLARRTACPPTRLIRGASRRGRCRRNGLEAGTPRCSRVRASGALLQKARWSTSIPTRRHQPTIFRTVQWLMITTNELTARAHGDPGVEWIPEESIASTPWLPPAGLVSSRQRACRSLASAQCRMRS